MTDIGTARTSNFALNICDNLFLLSAVFNCFQAVDQKELNKKCGASRYEFD